MRRNQRLSFVPPSLLLATLLIISPHSTSSSGGVDIPCQWASLMGASYNLQPLTKPLQGSTAGSCSYSIFDGDIPCTPAIEPSYNYVWNMCADVGTIDVPNACKKMAKSGVALQYVDLGNDAYNCLVIGKYDPSQDDLYFSLIDSSNPAKGVSMRYPQGEKCGTADKTGAIMRSATIDVKCANTPLKIVSAQEPTLCSYHLVMESYYGCPTECPITSNGLCNSHGHCHYDNILEAPYCYCNQVHFQPFIFLSIYFHFTYVL